MPITPAVTKVFTGRARLRGFRHVVIMNYGAANGKIAADGYADPATLVDFPAGATISPSETESGFTHEFTIDATGTTIFVYGTYGTAETF